MNAQTRKTLQRVLEQAHELETNGFSKYVMAHGRISARYSRIASDLTAQSEVIGPGDDAVKAFVLTLRMFVQDRDGISFRALAKLREQDTSLSESWQNEVSSMRNWLNQRLDAPAPVILHGCALSYREIFETFMYGRLAHSDEEKSKQYKSWEAMPEVFDYIRFHFYGLLMDALVVVQRLAAITREELVSSSPMECD